jgi:hypothetical protein
MMGGGTLRRSNDRERGEEAPVSPLRERARDAAEAIHSDNSARWFPINEVFPVYNYLYDYYRANPEDLRLRRLAGEALARLSELAQRLETNAINPLPPEWTDAKTALAEASEVFRVITEAW